MLDLLLPDIAKAVASFTQAMWKLCSCIEALEQRVILMDAEWRKRWDEAQKKK
jgi:hypothetical protein